MTQAIAPSLGTEGGEVRKQWWFLWWGIALLVLGPSIVILGTAWGMAESFITIETEKAPTPDELAVGVYHSFFAQGFGSATTLIGLTLLVPFALRFFLGLRRRSTE